MEVIASAPGKLVWLGEYAVLERAPALVMAVNRRARVRLTAALQDTSERTPSAAPRAGASRSVDTFLRADPSMLQAVARELDGAAAAAASLCAEVDSDALFMRAGEGPVKLGLGSSAALIVATAGALCALIGRPLPNVDALIRMHRNGQTGRGSGVDVAAALHGGVSIYRLDDRTPRCEPVDFPSELQWCCVWSGRAASTRDLLVRMAAWREASPSRYEAAMAPLKEAAEAGVRAIAHGAPDAVLDALREYGRQLGCLGDASGIDIVCQEHREIGAIATACGVAYKTCGAGGGDVGVAATRDPLALAEFRRRAAREGWQVLDLATDRHGLEARLCA
jgi:phosphomevalonate kinase